MLTRDADSGTEQQAQDQESTELTQSAGLTSSSEVAPSIEIAEPSDAAVRTRSRDREPMTPWQRIQTARRWFRAFRRTRPFWAGLWMAFGGYTILKYSMAPLQIIAKTGLNGAAGYVLGGGLVLCGLVTWCAPAQRYTFGVIAIVLAVVSLVASNLGGFFVGMLAGVLGGSMALGWGVKKPQRRGVRNPVRTPAESSPGGIR